ncbi:hypothetical protein [Streptomyces sp. NPDC005969]|uniref:hypothetical protein n=1 Tax=Streptomyces sp. NPDC005969 TaxID=3156722 RepID=UPI0033FAB526
MTGASRGIGQTAGARLATEGAVVIVHFGTDESVAAATVEFALRHSHRSVTITRMPGR